MAKLLHLLGPVPEEAGGMGGIPEFGITSFDLSMPITREDLIYLHYHVQNWKGVGGDDPVFEDTFFGTSSIAHIPNLGWTWIRSAGPPAGGVGYNSWSGPEYDFESGESGYLEIRGGYYGDADNIRAVAELRWRGGLYYATGFSGGVLSFDGLNSGANMEVETLRDYS